MHFKAEINYVYCTLHRVGDRNFFLSYTSTSEVSTRDDD